MKGPVFRYLLLINYLVLLFACGGPDLPDSVAIAYKEVPNQLDFNLHVKPILSDKCYACHGPDKANLKAGLQLNTAKAAYGELPENPGRRAIVPGNLHSSELFHRIMSSDPNEVMPPPEFKVELTDQEKAILTKWIENGAEFKPHWAFIKPQKPEVPKIKHDYNVHNPIDNFIISKLEQLALSPSPEADKELLLRRLTFDLTGLPPTLAEIEAFKADKSEDAYEKQVDRLLASVHYAEKMATDWMDVARFSDTYGYQVDRYRDMSPWRDWVIQAFHNNKPYDQFLVWQLAGDLLPDASEEQILATGFNRLHPQNMEDGIIGEEFRVENVSDRVAVLGDGLLGLTLSCARCHDHKYDPISQKEYFELFSFFNTINETGQISWDAATPPPTLALPTPKQEKVIRELKQHLLATTQYIQKVSTEEKTAIANWIQQASYQKLGSGIPKRSLVGHYSLDKRLSNTINPAAQAIMEREFSKEEIPNFTLGHKGSGLLLDGDAWLNCKGVGIFKRSDAFSIGLWVNLPEALEEGVIFHKNKGTTLHSYRGYHLYLKNNKLQWVMARTFPENAIIEETAVDIPKEEWVHLAVTYDGSSTASGTKIYLNGKEMETMVEQDNLNRDIVFNYLEDIIYKEPIEPNLKIGARWRGKGLTGAKVDDILVYERELPSLEILQIALSKEFEAIINTPPPQLNEAQKKPLRAYFLANHSKKYQSAIQNWQAAQLALVDSLENVQEVMVMQEMRHPRKTYILERGVYDQYGKEVFPNTPKSILSMPNDLPKNRLGLAQWIIHPDHPLTARVAVNRYWQNYFGRGLVKTAQDFGNQGELPSHPELLDWLAVGFMESGWDIKALQKRIVTSATYRQSSQGRKEIEEMDKENVWLSRGPKIRLTSEMIRDNALSASGLLNKEVGGESVYPYQPKGLWAMNFDPYPQDTGQKLYRRSLYTMWRRTNPNPTLATFDQPERNVCTVKRQKTNTPLQALVLLNDPTFVEAAKVIGEQMTRLEVPAESIKTAFTKLTGKAPNDRELQLLLKVQEKEYKIFQEQPEKTKGWLEAGAYQIDPKLDKNLVAANAIVASIILNGDVTITKR